MTDKKYMDAIWRKVRWEAYQRNQLEEAEATAKRLKREERRAKFNLFVPITCILLVVYVGFGLDISFVWIGGLIELIAAVYYEQFVSSKIIRSVSHENNH